MFGKSASLYDEFYGFLDYQAAANNLHALILDRLPGANTLLDVACGTGRYLEYLSLHFETAGLDILPPLLDKARLRCPGIPFHQGDMRTFDLGCKFDVVTCLFCSIGYVVTLENAQLAIARMAAHLKPEGLLVLEPWVTPEQCWTNRITSEVLDKPELKVVRMHTHEKVGTTSVYDIHYLVGTPLGVDHFVEREVLGLFTDEEYLDAFGKAGLEAVKLDMELFPGHRYGVFVGRKSLSAG